MNGYHHNRIYNDISSLSDTVDLNYYKLYYRMIRIPQDDNKVLYYAFYTTEEFVNFIVSPEMELWHIVLEISSMNSETTSNTTTGCHYSRIDDDTLGDSEDMITAVAGHVVISTASSGANVYYTTLKIVLSKPRRIGILNLNGNYSDLDYGEPKVNWYAQ